jgi:hypothetical protein
LRRGGGGDGGVDGGGVAAEDKRKRESGCGEERAMARGHALVGTGFVLGCGCEDVEHRYLKN